MEFKKKNLAIVIQTYFKKIFRIIVDFNQPKEITSRNIHLSKKNKKNRVNEL